MLVHLGELLVCLPHLSKGSRALVWLVTYLGIGCLFFRLVEEKPVFCDGESEESGICMEPWTIIDSLYFSMVTMSTVGYGDLTPSTDGSRTFVGFYVIIGVTVVFGKVSGVVARAMDASESVIVDHFLCGCLKRYKVVPTSKGIDLNGNGTVDFVPPPGPLVFWIQHTAFPLTVLAVFQLVSARVFVATQSSSNFQLTFAEASWHCFVTMTTVGYGDVFMSTQASRLWAFFHILFSVSWLAGFIKEVQDVSKRRKLQLQELDMLNRQLDSEMIESLDRDGAGVDRLEFVVGMLINLGAELCGQPLEWSTVEPFLAQFDTQDIDHSGKLEKKDLALMVERKRRMLDMHCGPQGASPTSVQSKLNLEVAKSFRSGLNKTATVSAWQIPKSPAVSCPQKKPDDSVRPPPSTDASGSTPCPPAPTTQNGTLRVVNEQDGTCAQSPDSSGAMRKFLEVEVLN